MGNVTVDSGRALLDILAEDSVEADQFRRFILRQSTTYYGESDNWYAANCGHAPVLLLPPFGGTLTTHSDQKCMLAAALRLLTV